MPIVNNRGVVKSSGKKLVQAWVDEEVHRRAELLARRLGFSGMAPWIRKFVTDAVRKADRTESERQSV